MATPTRKRPTTPTPQEQLSEIDWDKLDELDAQEDAPPMMDAEWAPTPSAPQSRPWTMQDLAEADLPQTQEMLAMAVWYSNLDDLKADLSR